MKKLMKSNISKILGVLLLVGVINLSKCTVFAQQNTMPSSVVKESFNNEFENAINTTWRKTGPVHCAIFSQNGEYSVAYLSERGSLIASGRKIPHNQLPLIVQKELKPLRESFETRYGALREGSIFEMTKEGYTQYYIPLDNRSHSIVLKASGTGIIVLKKGKVKNPPVVMTDVLAKY